MRVALTNPPFSRLVYGEEYTIKSITPCLGLFYMQAYCDDLAEIEVFEGEFYESNDALVRALREFRPDILGVTTNTTTWPLCVELAKRVDAPLTLAGGPYSAFRVEESLRYYDAVCVGDGEVTLRRLLESADPSATPGLVYKNAEGTICKNPAAPLPPLDEIPQPLHDRMQLGWYQASPHRDLPAPFATMVTSRGCGFACTFCLSANGGLNGGRYRVRSVNNVVEEIRALQSRHGVRSIQFWDDTFTMRKARTRELCSALKDVGLKYVCNTRTDKMDAETADLLAASGCVGVFFGVESGSERILDANHQKGVTNDQVRAAVRECRRVGIRTTTSFIFGSIDDNHETIEDSIALSLELDSDYVLYNIYTAHPGTAGYYCAIQEGIIQEYEVDIDLFRGEPVGVPTICRTLSRRELLERKAEAYVRYYRSQGEAKYAEIISTYEAELVRLASASM